MSKDKKLDEDLEAAFKQFNQLKKMKKKVKRQRDKMRKRGIKLIQDYCN